MKRIYIISLLPIVFSLFLTLTLKADEPVPFDYNGLHYQTNSTGTAATLLKSDDYQSMTEIVVPDSAYFADDEIMLPVTDMDNNCFANCTQLEKITLGRCLDRPGSGGSENYFLGCTALKHAVIRIGYTDGNCSTCPFTATIMNQIETLEFENTVRSIQKGDWWNNGINIKTLHLPASLADNGISGVNSMYRMAKLENLIVDEGGYYYASDTVLYNKKSDGTIYLIFYPTSKTSTSFTVPNGCNIISTNAFYQCKHLQEVRLPATVRTISSSGFNGCSNLTAIGLNEGLKTIGGSAFMDCENLSSVSFPTSLTSVGSQAFYNCSALSSIDLSACSNLTSIYSSAFNNCTSLTTILLPSSVTIFESNVFSNTAWYKNDDNWEGNYLYLGDILVSSKPENISGAVSIKAGTRVLAGWSLQSCAGMTGLSLPATVKYINQSALTSCTGLIDLDLQNIVGIENNAFLGCSNLQSATFGNNIKRLGDYIFSGCTALRSLTVPIGTPKAIVAYGNIGSDLNKGDITLHVPSGTEALYQVVDYWKDFTISADLSVAGARYTIDGLVYKILSVEDKTVAVTWEKERSGSNPTYTSLTGDIVIPEKVTINTNEYTVTEIDAYAFYYCKDITSLSIPKTVQIIGRGACANCNTNLTSVTIAENSQLEEIGPIAFYTNSVLTTFANVPAKVKVIGDSAFKLCAVLETFTMPISSLKKVGNEAFYCCYKLPDFVLSEGIQEIGYRAFYACNTNVKRAYIPASVTSLGDEAWNGNNNLKKWEVDPSNTHYCTDDAGVLYNKTKTHLLNCFANNGMTEYDIPASVTTMSPCAFYNVTTLKRVLFPNNLKTIPYSAFSGCNNVKKLDLTNVEYIEHNAFEGCSAVDTIILGENCKELENSCFWQILSSSLAGTSRAPFFLICHATTPPSAGPTTVADIGISAPAKYRYCLVPLSAVDQYRTRNYWSSNSALKGYTYWDITPNNIAYGSTSGSGLQIEDSIVSPVATPARNCRFVKWSDGETTASHSPITVDLEHDNFTLIAEFEPIPLSVGDTFILPNADGVDMLYSVLTQEPGNMTVAVGKQYDKKAIDPETEGAINIPATVNYFGDVYDVVLIDYNAFKECKKITSVIIPASVKIINPYAFEDCEALAQINLTEGLEEIEHAAFQNTPITAITLPTSLKKMESYIFYDCKQLASVNIPDGIEYIEECTFGYCSQLTTISLPTSVKYIGYAAFNSSGLTTLHWTTANIERLGLSIFNNTPWLDNLPATNNAKYADDLLIYQDGASALTEFTVEEGTRVITASAMGWYCDNLQSVTIPASVQYIGSQAFYDNTALTKCTLYATTPPLIYQEQWVEKTDVTANDLFKMYAGSPGQFNNKTNMVIYVPKEALPAYRQNEQWNMMELRPIGGWDVTFIDGNGNLIGDTQHIEHRMMPALPDSASVPIKDTTLEWVYVFNGKWLLSTGVTVTAEQTTFSDMTYTALYDSSPHPYTLTFVNEDETFLWDTVVGYGLTFPYRGPTPVKDSTLEHVYAFTGWDAGFVDDVTTVAGDKTYKAVFTESARPYTITFVNDDANETVLWTSQIAYDSVIRYGGTIPTKDSTAQYSYSFKGWSDNFEEGMTTVSGDVTFKAEYDSTVRSYTVTFVDADVLATVLWDSVMEYGAAIIYGGAVPTKDSTAQYSYSFKGWSDNFEEGVTTVSGDVTFKAEYDSTVNTYTVIFIDGLTGDTLLRRDSIAYGNAVSAPVIPQHEGYVSNGWDREGYNNVQSNITITVTYTEQTGFSDKRIDKPSHRGYKIIEKGKVIIIKGEKRYTPSGELLEE